MPRLTVTNRSLESASRTFGGSGMFIRMVASASIRVTPWPMPVVAAVVEEQRIVRIGLEACLRVLGGDGARLAAVTREARPAVAAEGFALEKVLAVLPGIDGVSLTGQGGDQSCYEHQGGARTDDERSDPHDCYPPPEQLRAGFRESLSETFSRLRE